MSDRRIVQLGKRKSGPQQFLYDYKQAILLMVVALQSVVGSLSFMRTMHSMSVFIRVAEISQALNAAWSRTFLEEARRAVRKQQWRVFWEDRTLDLLMVVFLWTAFPAGHLAGGLFTGFAVHRAMHRLDWTVPDELPSVWVEVPFGIIRCWLMYISGGLLAWAAAAVITALNIYRSR